MDKGNLFIYFFFGLMILSKFRLKKSQKQYLLQYLLSYESLQYWLM